jgi:elongation factor 1-gamma
VWKAAIAGQYTGVTVKEAEGFQMGVTNKTPEFLAKFPLGKVPAAETADGPLFESNAIARYVARSGKNNLYGANNYEAALVEQWIEWVGSEISLASDAWTYPIFGYAPFNAQATAKAKEDIRKGMKFLNEHLLNHTFLVGQRVTLADIVVAMAFHRLYTVVLDANFRKPYQNVTRWFQTCVHQPQFKTVMGEVKLCEVAQQAKETHAAPAEKPKKEEKKPEPKKEEKKPKKKAADDDDAEEEDEFKEEKPKSALDLLPPSTMQLDEWKRQYSNNDTRTVAVPWLWSNFDAAGFSIWFADYKYSAELKKLFMTSNAVTGWMQRLDRLRKYGFGTVLIFGEDDKEISISSVWIFRGQDVPQEMKDCDDYELYEWKKVDLTNAAQKKLVEDELAWEGDFNGRGPKPKDGKIFR